MSKESDPQSVLSGLSEAAMFLTLTVRSGEEAAVRDALSDVAAACRSIGFRSPPSEPSVVVGVGSDVWDRLYATPRPAGLHPFPGFAGSVHRAPATRGDVLLHIRASRMDACFGLARQIVDPIAASVEVVDEIHGFRSIDNRDLLGFVDGTENPDGSAAEDAVFDLDLPPSLAGGSYLVTQKYVHDLAGWNALTVEEQERAIGRTKLDDVELPDDVKPSNSHVALNTITDEQGRERKIVRYNMPFGEVGTATFGTYFIAYAKDLGVIEEMLTHMFIGDPPGNHDRILDFSTAVTGCAYFVPPAAFLKDPDAGSDDAGSAADDGGAASSDALASPDTSDQSLGIGSLRGS